MRALMMEFRWRFYEYRAPHNRQELSFIERKVVFDMVSVKLH